MTNSNPNVFAIVLNYNGYDDTVKCIESLIKATFRNIQIVIVDNASPDGSGHLLKKKFPRLCFIFSDKNNGYASGMNIGIKHALKNNADFILLVNNDTVVSENFLEPLLEEMKNENTGIVSSKVLYRDNPGVIYCAGGRIDYLRCATVAEYQGRNNLNYANCRREITLAEGCFMLVRKEVFNKVGFFNEKYFMYMEDGDFSLRVIKHFRLVYTNDSIIYHKSGAGDSWDEFTPLYSYYYTRNRLWFFEDCSFPYRVYVILFSLLISVLKSLTMYKSFILNSHKRRNLKKSFIALWKGTKDGVLLILKIKNL